MKDSSLWDEQGADSCDQLREPEHDFSAELMRQNTTDYLRQEVPPVE